MTRVAPPDAAGGTSPARPAPTTPSAAATPVPQHTTTPGPGRTPPPVPSPTTTSPKPLIPHFSKVIVILTENEEYSSIISDLTAPYINSLPSGGPLATPYCAVSPPSLPTYPALTGRARLGCAAPSPPPCAP